MAKQNPKGKKNLQRNTPTTSKLHSEVLEPAEFTLYGVPFGDPRALFQISATAGTSVYEWLKLAKQENSRKCTDADVNDLILWKLKEPIPSNVRMNELPKCWDNLSAFCVEMDLAEEIGHYFQAQVPPKHIHVILQIPTPQTGKRPREDSETNLPLSKKQKLPKPVAPSSANARQVEDLLGDQMDYGRPLRKESIPLSLLHEVFSQFIEDTQMHISTKEDNDFMSRLREEMLKVHQKEADYTMAFRHIWENHIQGFPINAGIIGASNFATDGHLRVGKFYQLIVEGKRELDGMSSDPLLQLSMYYIAALHETKARLEGEGKKIQDLFPCLLIYYAGPYIGFAGAVHTNTPQIEVLTPFYPVHTNPHDPSIILQVTRSLAGVRKAMVTLKEHYNKLLKQIPSTSDSWSFPYKTCYTAWSGGLVKFRYLKRIDETRLVFCAEDMEGKPLIVKFTRKYSKDVHEHCANSGVAPALHAVENLPGGWIMVIMDHLDPTIYSHPEVPLSKDAQLRGRIEKAMNKLHEGRFVHGDLREVNMMVKKSEIGYDQDLGVMILDFDWSGEEGKVRYPPNVNTNIFRPKGVEDNALIMQSHDKEMVRHMFGENDSTIRPE